MPEFDSAPARAGKPSRPASRLTRSRFAKPLLTSLGTATMIVASTFVVVAVSSTGSLRPWDWMQADPSAAVSRYRDCGQQGLGAIGCMLSSGFRPAAASGGSHRSSQPLFSTATVQDLGSAASPGASSGKPSTSRGASPARPSAPAVRPSVPPHLVRVPAVDDDLRARCPAPAATPRPQVSPAIEEPEDVCPAPSPSPSPRRGDD